MPAENIIPHQFQKGVCPNPKGRGKGVKDGPTAYLRRLMKKAPPETCLELLRARFDGDENVKVKNWAEAIGLVLGHMACSGDVQAAKVVLDRADGPVRQQVEHSGPDGGPVQFVFPALPDEEPDERRPGE